MISTLVDLSYLVYVNTTYRYLKRHAYMYNVNAGNEGR
jgi:hypothetical protein